MSFWGRVKRVVEKSDVVLEILDARFPRETRHRQLEDLVKGEGKKLLIVLNKADLISKEKAERLKAEFAKEFPTIFVSAKDRNGSGLLRTEIGKLTRGKKAVVGVCGYPNTGKSSLINLLCGRRAAKTSPRAGFTRGEQIIKVSEKIYIFDTPGIFPYDERDEAKLVLLSAKNADQVEDAELCAMKIVELIKAENARKLDEFYGVSTEGRDAEETLKAIAIAKNRMLKGNRPDTETIARQLIADWQKGKLRV